MRRALQRSSWSDSSASTRVPRVRLAAASVTQRTKIQALTRSSSIPTSRQNRDVTAPGQCRIRSASLPEQQELHRVVRWIADSWERVDHEPRLALGGQDVLVMQVSVQEHRCCVRCPQLTQ